MKSKLIKLQNPLKVIGISQSLYLVISLVMFYSGTDEEIYIPFLIFSTWIFNLPSIISARKEDPEGIKWKDLNIISLINSLISGLICFVCFEYLGMADVEQSWVSFVFPFVSGMLVSSIISIFLEKGPIKHKIKRLISIILFVWALYEIVTNLLKGESNDEEEVGFDTDGDGKIDTTFVDTDGDGIVDTIGQDTDGDGIIDKISSDTDGDGLIDTVVADTDGDGFTDTIIKDIDVDGDGKSDFRITKRKGKGLT